MKRLSLALLLSIGCMSTSTTNAWAKPSAPHQGVRKAGAPRRHGPASAKWLPKSVRDVFQPDRQRSTQGPKLQGGKLEISIVHANIDSSPGRTAPSTELEGLKRGWPPFKVKVVSQMQEPCPPEAGSRQPFTLYELELDGANPCEGESLAPESSRQYRTACEQEHWETYRGKALAVEGGWGTRMNYVSSTADQPFSTFSCMSGAMAKCLRFGYRPWEGAAQSEMFQACIRAARGDYCGTGMAYTCDGTLFDIVDTSGIQQRATETSDERLEADWTSAGASCVNTARLPGCGSEENMKRLLTVIKEECEAHRHPIQIGGCRETCPEGATCGSPVRTWMITGQTHLCEASQMYCPPEPTASSW